MPCKYLQRALNTQVRCEERGERFKLALMRWLQFLGIGGRRKTPFNNVDASGNLTAGRVTDHLLLGGELGPHDWPALRDAGVTAIVNLQQEQQDSFAHDEKNRRVSVVARARWTRHDAETIGAGRDVFARRHRQRTARFRALQSRSGTRAALVRVLSHRRRLQRIGRVAHRGAVATRNATHRRAEPPRLREFSAHFGSEHDEAPLAPPSSIATRHALNSRNANSVESENSASAAGGQSPVKINAASRASHKRRG